MALGKEVFELAASNPAPIFVEVEMSGSKSPEVLPEGPVLVGHQYLFIVFPFGNVRLGSPADSVMASTYQQLTVRGLKPITSKSHVFGPLPTLRIKVASLSLSAFDLLVTRRVTSSIEGTAILLSPSGQVVWQRDFEGHSAEYRRYGFQAELEKSLLESLESALSPVCESTAAHILGRPRAKYDVLDALEPRKLSKFDTRPSFPDHPSQQLYQG